MDDQPLTADAVQPTNASATQPQPQQQPPQEDEEQQPQQPGQPSQLPQELVKLPFMQAVLAGAPPAVSDRIKDFSTKPFAKLLYDNQDAIRQSGIGFYRSLSGELGVIFNGLHIHPEDLQAADKMGKLKELAPDLDKVDHDVSKSGAGNPVLHAKGVPGGMASPVSASVPPQGGAAATAGPSGPSPAPAASGLPASAQRQLLYARVKNLQPGPPSTGPQPGAGRIVNQALKPVI